MIWDPTWRTVVAAMYDGGWMDEPPRYKLDHITVHGDGSLRPGLRAA